MQFLHDPSQGIRVISSETIGHFLKKIIFIHFLVVGLLFVTYTIIQYNQQ